MTFLQDFSSKVARFYKFMNHWLNLPKYLSIDEQFGELRSNVQHRFFQWWNVYVIFIWVFLTLHRVAKSWKNHDLNRLKSKLMTKMAHTHLCFLFFILNQYDNEKKNQWGLIKTSNESWPFSARDGFFSINAIVFQIYPKNG